MRLKFNLHLVAFITKVSVTENLPVLIGLSFFYYSWNFPCLAHLNCCTNNEELKRILLFLKEKKISGCFLLIELHFEGRHAWSTCEICCLNFMLKWPDLSSVIDCQPLIQTIILCKKSVKCSYLFLLFSSTINNSLV